MKTLGLLVLVGFVGLTLGPLHFGPDRLHTAQLVAFAGGGLLLALSALVGVVGRIRRRPLSPLLLAPMIFLAGQLAGTLVYKVQVTRKLPAAAGLSAGEPNGAPESLEVWPFSFHLVSWEPHPEVRAAYSNDGPYRFLILSDGRLSIRD